MSHNEHLRVASQNSRARLLGASASLLDQQWERTIADFKGLCAYCLLAPFEVMEHFIPIRVAGTTVNNCIPACNDCNMRKSDHTGDGLVAIFGGDTIERIEKYLVARSNREVYPPVEIKPRWSTRRKREHVPSIPYPRDWVRYSLLEEKSVYDIKDLFFCLDIPMRVLSEASGLGTVALTRIRDGYPVKIDTANKLLKEFARIYERPFYLSKVVGINVAISGRKKKEGTNA